MTSLFLKCLLGAAAVLLIALLSKTRNFFIAGLVPLFPTFALIAHYIVGSERSVADLRTTALFGLWSLIPYAVYLLAVYWLSVRYSLASTLLLATLAWTAAAIVLLAAWLAWHFCSDRPVRYSSPEEHFKYGSIGSEVGGSVLQPVGGILPPYWIFKVLPAVCPDKLPGGYASLGLIFERGHEMPIGVSQRFRLGFEQAGLNCSVCHTGTYRATPASEPKIGSTSW